MGEIGTAFVYVNQEAAERVADQYRGMLIDVVDELHRLAIEIDSLKVSQVAADLFERLESAG